MCVERIRVKRVSVFSALVAMALLAACAEPPAQELSTARQALEAARNAEAELYAPDEYRSAEEAFRQAEAEIAAQNDTFALTRNYDRAKEQLKQAVSEADSAAAAAAEKKEAARAQAEAALADAQLAIQTAVQSLENAPKGKGTRAELEMLRADLQAAEAALQQAQKTLDAGKYMEAISQLRAVAEKGKLVNDEIQQALAKKRRS